MYCKSLERWADYGQDAEVMQTIGLYDLTVFLVVMKALVCGEKWLTEVQKHEKTVSQSQAIVNRLTSAVFESKEITGPGYALLQLNKSAQDEEPILLRYNQRFSNIL